MLSVITIKEPDKWDSIVKSFNNYDVNYLFQYSKAFGENCNGEPLLIYYVNGNTKAMNVIIKRDIALCDQFQDILHPNEWFDISTPYGYGGFWIEGQNNSTLEGEYEKYCIESGFISEFVRFHLFSSYRYIYNGTVEKHTNNIVRSLNLDVDEMLMSFEHKVRKNLKKANNAGLEIQIDETGSRIGEFLNIYYDTMDRNGAKPDFFFPESFFMTINKMFGNYVYFYVLQKNRIISAELVLYGKENGYSFLGGTDSNYYNLRPNDFLKFEVIKWAKIKGLKNIILGGGYGEDDGIFKYKKSFAPDGIHKFYIGKRIFNQEKYDELIRRRGKQFDSDKKTNYFPLYRS